MSHCGLIGLSSSEVRRAGGAKAVRQGEPRRRELSLGFAYPRAVERAGGVPVILPPVGGEAIELLLDGLSGVLLTGGPDIDPCSYGGPLHPELGPTEPELDRFELALVEAADRRGMPILAICRGAQVLNLARGGTLHQHLPDAVGMDVAHRQDHPGERPSHAVRVTSASRLAAAVGPHARVNSFHHQAAARPGADLVAVAHSADGVIEGLEDKRRSFVVGVQWHAECLVDRRQHAALFAAFTAAAARYAQASRSARAA